MSQPDFRATIASYIREQAQPIEKYSHQPRLYQLAAQLGAAYPHDDDVLYAAAWLHDIGVFSGHRPSDPLKLADWDNVTYALEIVPRLLADWQFPSEKIAAVIAAIATHLPSQQPTTPEGVLLRDADILEQLGAVGVLRTVCKIGRDTRFHTFTNALAALQRALDSLPHAMYTAEARELAAPRIATLRAFLAAANAEAGDAPL